VRRIGAFDLVRIRLNRGLRLLTASLGDLYPGEENPAES
jgi:hypothetical protein